MVKKMESENIQLVVKSPNQSLKDFPVECRPDWSVRILKQRLSMLYPSKPSPGNQRLIHSGKLLQDHMITGEVLKQPEGGGVVTIHLVCIQATSTDSGSDTVSPLPSSIATSSPGVTEHRQSTPSTPEGRGQQPSATPLTTGANTNHPYHRSMSMDSIYATTNTPHRFWRQQSLTTPPVYNPPNVAQATPPFVHPMYAAYMHHWYQQQQQQQLRHRSFSSTNIGANLPERNEELNVRPDHHGDQDAAAVPAAAAAAERRDNEQFQDNVAVNAGPGMADMGQNDFRRDWVDSFYKLFSFLLLMTLVYFSASLSKFLAFAIIIILLLIYQAGWFSVRRNRQVRNPAREDGAAAEQVADQVDAGDTSGNTDAVEGAVAEEDGPSVLGTVAMFITSFFTSLVPQRAPELAGN